MALNFKSVPGIKELLEAQVRDPSLDMVARRTEINVEQMLPLLPAVTDDQIVVDLGCGIGRMTVGLQRLWNPNALYYYADGNHETDAKIGKHQWNPYKKGQNTRGFYSSMDVAFQFIAKNCFAQQPQPIAITINDQNQWDLYPSEVDVLFSMYAVGTHYPLEMYETTYKRILRPGATFIFTYDRRVGKIPEYFDVRYNEPDLWIQHAQDEQTRKRSRNHMVAAIYTG